MAKPYDSIVLTGSGSFFSTPLLTVSGPLVGKYLSVWGVRAIFPAGFLIDGGTFILFGLLQWVDDITTFLVFSYIIRFIEVNKRPKTVNVTVDKSARNSPILAI